MTSTERVAIMSSLGTAAGRPAWDRSSARRTMRAHPLDATMPAATGRGGHLGTLRAGAARAPRRGTS
jgi:hypothetical protein